MKNTSISLSGHFQDMTKSLVDSGRYGSVSDVVRDALRLLEAREAAIKRLDDAIDIGLASGDAVDFDFDHYLASKRADFEMAEAAE